MLLTSISTSLQVNNFGVLIMVVVGWSDIGKSLHLSDKLWEPGIIEEDGGLGLVHIVDSLARSVDLYGSRDAVLDSAVRFWKQK